VDAFEAGIIINKLQLAHGHLAGENETIRAEILRPDQVNLLFTVGFVKPRDKALFGVCLYAACRINEACTLFTQDVFGMSGVRSVLLLRSFNTKGKRDTREIQIHPTLRRYLEEYDPLRRKEFLFPGRHGLGHIHKASADRILREACLRVGLEGVSNPLLSLSG
jgi:integrase/recombinase XerD